jgi:hypothetical protein
VFGILARLKGKYSSSAVLIVSLPSSVHSTTLL